MECRQSSAVPGSTGRRWWSRATARPSAPGSSGPAIGVRTDRGESLAFCTCPHTPALLRLGAPPDLLRHGWRPRAYGVVAPPAPALAATGPLAYVANIGGNTVSVFDTATNAVTATVPVGSSPLTVALTGRAALVVAHAGAGQRAP
ncbi:MULTISPECIES: hypothetical protein [unclassified Streptomyces]|uniref:hypothetical protein n=1 Tax=unclassified Streptomyces TaxID=2593676 RepID=UPI002E329F9F|nr:MULTISPECIES: hypothetical protein [unclassified Streptomyces]WUC68374.1 hypothetical protein OG861_31325 [Streptomyces sp. NBC_00539]